MRRGLGVLVAVFQLLAVSPLQTRKESKEHTIPVRSLPSIPDMTKTAAFVAMSGVHMPAVAIPPVPEISPGVAKLLESCFGAQCPHDPRLGSPHTCELTASDFSAQGQFELGLPSDTVVEFFKPTCPHCLRLVPIYEKVGMEFQSQKPPGNFANVKTCRFDGSAKDKITMAIRQKYKIKTFPCIRVFKAGWKFGDGAFLGKEYDAHITRMVDTVEDFIVASLKEMGVAPKLPGDAALAVSASKWVTTAEAFGSFKEAKAPYLKERTSYIQGCPADEEDEEGGEEGGEEERRRRRRGGGDAEEEKKEQ